MKTRTLAILKPDAVRKKHIGDILAIIEKNNFQITALKMLHLSKPEAEGFYQEHEKRPFFTDLVKFMISGSIVVMVIEGESAFSRFRNLIGATNPKEAEPNTIRSMFATSIDENAIHGSDSEQSASREICYFFKEHELDSSS
ncbi:MAG: nucleoside-diphosphate kinase [Methylacidiphilales bacterium]|nr:nucleoside-diphosphate kinase [Candidatus Methylacidiphilales bacterium]